MDGRQLGKPLPPKTVEVAKRLSDYTPTVSKPGPLLCRLYNQRAHVLLSQHILIWLLAPLPICAPGP